MACTRFFELCLDVVSADVEQMDRLTTFWAAVSGGQVMTPPGGGVADVIGGAEHEGIAICPVPEPKTVKHRVHLDVYTDSIQRLVDLGAQVLLPAAESGFGWTVLADPEGGEFCAFLKDPMPDYRIHGVGIDSEDPERLAHWWAQVYDVATPTNPEPGLWQLHAVTPDPVLTWDFAAVPEPKTVKNRLHWDVYGDPLELEQAGAERLWEVPGRTRPIAWTVLADPEGNEFCVFPPS